MSPKHSSLAFDETIKEFENPHFSGNFEPDLKVIVNVHYSHSSLSSLVSDEIIQVDGRITVSF